MAFLACRGLVIRSNLYRDSDRIITVLTKNHGTLTARASAAAKSNSPLALASAALVLCDFVFTAKGDYLYVKEAEIIEHFSPIQENVELLTTAAHLLEITADTAVEGESCSQIYPLLLYALYRLAKAGSDYRLLAAIFEWKIMSLLGYQATLGLCSYCKETEPSWYGAFSYTHGQIYCKKSACLTAAGHYQLLSYGCLAALSYIYESSLEKLFAFTVSPQVREEIIIIARHYLEIRLEKKYRKMELLDDLPSW